MGPIKLPDAPKPRKKKKSAPPVKESPTPFKKRSLFRRIFKFFIFFVFFLLVLIVAAGAALQYFFPGEAIKPFAERELSKTLKMPVKIGGIKFNLFQGIQVTEVNLGEAEKFFDVDELTLNYDLTQLFRAKLIIDKVVIDRPRLRLVSKNGIWNFQSLLDAGKRPQADELEKKEEKTGFFLPFAVDLKQLTINNVSVSVNIDDETFASIEGLTIKAAGKAGLSKVSADVQVIMSGPENKDSAYNVSFLSRKDKGINVRTLLIANLNLSADSIQSGRVDGTLEVKNIFIKIGQTLPVPDIRMELDAIVDLGQQTADLKKFLLKIGEHSGMDVSAQANDILDDPHFSVRIQKAKFDLGELLAIAGNLAPPLQAKGIVRISDFETSGNLKNYQPENIEISGGKISLANISASYPEASASLKGFNAKIDLQQIGLTHLVPYKIRASVDLQMQSAKFGDIAIKVPGGKLNIGMALDANLNLDRQTVDLKKFILKIAKHNEIDLSLQANHILSEPGFNLQIHHAAFDLKELLSLAGDLAPPVKAGGTINISGLKISGKLKNNQPENLEISGGKITLANISASYPEASANLKGLDANIDLKGIILAKLVPHKVQAAVDLKIQSGKVGDVSIKGLNQTLNINAVGPNLPKASIAFAMDLKGVRYAHPDLGVLDTSVTLSGGGQGNFAKGNLDAFKLGFGIGKMFDGKASGRLKGFGKKSFNVKYLINIGLKEALEFIPEKLKEETGLERLSGKVRLDGSLKGKLDKNFMPVHAGGNVGIKVSEINVALKQPSVKLTGFNLEANLPAQYDSKRGIKTPGLKFKARFQDLQAMDKWQIGSFATDTTLKLSKFVSLKGEPGAWPIELKTTLRVGSIKSREPILSIASARLNLDASAPKAVGRVILNGDVSLKKIDALGKVTADELLVDFKLGVNDLSLTKTMATVNASIKSPFLKMEGLEIGFNDVEFESVSHQNLMEGNIDIDRVSLNLADILRLEAKGTLKEWGKSFFSLTGKVLPFQLDAVLAKLPQKALDSIKGMEMNGTLSMDVKAEGRIPGKKDLDKMDIPVTAEGQFKLANFNFSWPDNGLNVENMNISKKFTLKDNAADVFGNISFGKVTYKDLLGEEGLVPEWDYHFSLENWDKFEINKHHLSLKNKGFNQHVTGRVEGLKGFLTGKRGFTLPELLKRLEVSFSARNSLELGKALSMVKGLEAQGVFAAHLDLNMMPGQKIVASGGLEFEKFNAQYEKVAKAMGIDGKFLFRKQIFLDRKLLADQPKTFSAASKGFFNQLRAFSSYKNIFRVGSVEFGPHRASNIGLDIFFKDNQLVVEKFLLDILGGSVAGNLFLTQTKQGPALKFFTEFAGLDFNKLVGEKTLKKDEQAEIDGSFQFGFQINQSAQGERISLDQIKIKVYINRIGAEVFDRILLFLDPEESKPAIVDTRSKLKLASPHRVIISLENGNLNVQAWLKNKILGGIIKAPELKRIPVASLKQFKNLQEQIQALSRFQQVLNYLAAQGIEFDEDGNMVLF